jgi:hypothetical protein
MGAIKIEEMQAVVGASGLSNGPDAYSIYHDEFRIIGKKRAIDFSSLLPKYKLKSIFRYIPTYFSLARDLSWLVNSAPDQR